MEVKIILFLRVHLKYLKGNIETLFKFKLAKNALHSFVETCEIHNDQDQNMCHQLPRNISVTLTKRHCVARTAATIMAKSGDSCENGAHSALYKRKLGYFFCLARSGRNNIHILPHTYTRTHTHSLSL